MVAGDATDVWGRTVFIHGDRESQLGVYGLTGPQYEGDFIIGQGGVDLYRDRDESGATHVGVYGAVGTGNVDVTHIIRNTNAGEDDLTGYSLAGYATYYGAGGWYVDGVLQGTWYDLTADPKRMRSLETDGVGLGASFEGGYAFDLGGGWAVEPQGQLIYQNIDISNSADIGAAIRFHDEESLEGRIGVRFVGSWLPGESGEPGLVSVWFRPSVWHEFLDGPQTEFNWSGGSIAFQSVPVDWLDLDFGASGRIGSATFVFASVGYQTAIEGEADSIEAEVGLQTTW